MSIEYWIKELNKPSREAFKKFVGILYWMGICIVGVSIPMCIFTFLNSGSYYGLLEIGIGIALICIFREQSKQISLKSQIKVFVIMVAMSGFLMWCLTALFLLPICCNSRIDFLIKGILIVAMVLIGPQLILRLINKEDWPITESVINDSEKEKESN
jgi:hypothetical protein